MKTTILKLRLKNTLDRIYGQLDIAEEKTGEYDHVTIKTNQIKTEKNDWQQNRTLVNCKKILSGLVHEGLESLKGKKYFWKAMAETFLSLMKSTNPQPRISTNSKHKKYNENYMRKNIIKLFRTRNK